MTPRVAGALLILISVLAGVLAGATISHPVWGVPAAVLLAFATVGMLAGLLWLFRRSWADKTWPPAPAMRSDAERGRRAALGWGIALLAMVPLLTALAVWSVIEGEDRFVPVYIGLYAAVYGAAGVALVRFGSGRHTTPAEPDEERTPEGTDTREGPIRRDADGWEQLGRIDLGLFALVTGPSWIIALILPLQLANIFSDDPLWAVVAWIVAVGLVGGLTLLIVRNKLPRVWVDVEGERVRSARRIARWSELTTAQLIAASAWAGSRRTLVLVLHGPDGLRVPLVLRRRGLLGLSRHESTIARRLIEASPLEMPRAKDDPRGRFTRFNFPGYVTKDEALDLVAHPPKDDDPLPGYR